MSLLDRGYAAFKRLVLMDDKVERLREDIAELKATVRDQQNRLIRIETIIQLGMAGGVGSPSSQAVQPRLPRE